LLAPDRAQPALAAGVRYLDEIFTGVSVTENLVYGSAPNYAGVPTDLKLDLYQPVGDTERNRPAIVFIHGGSFSGGSKSEESQLGVLAAKRGYVVVSIDYRVVAGALTDLAKLAWAIPAAQHDAQAAVR
jgi:acetyl esterase/lipase